MTPNKTTHRCVQQGDRPRYWLPRASLQDAIKRLVTQHERIAVYAQRAAVVPAK